MNVDTVTGMAGVAGAVVAAGVMAGMAVEVIIAPDIREVVIPSAMLR